MFYLFSTLQVMILNIHRCQNVQNIYLLRFFPSISACFHCRLEDIGPALSQLISISLFLEGEGGWELAEQWPNNKILKGMHNILIMPNTTPIETAKIWGNFPRL